MAGKFKGTGVARAGSMAGKFGTSRGVKVPLKLKGGKPMTAATGARFNLGKKRKEGTGSGAGGG